MGFLHYEPPQGTTTEQGLSIIIGPTSPKISPPQQIGIPGIPPDKDDMLFNVTDNPMLFNNSTTIMEYN